MSRTQAFSGIARLTAIDRKKVAKKIVGYTLIGEAIALPLWALFSPDVPCPANSAPPPPRPMLSCPAETPSECAWLSDGRHWAEWGRKGSRIDFRVYDVNAPVDRNPVAGGRLDTLEVELLPAGAPPPEQVLQWIEVERTR